MQVSERIKSQKGVSLLELVAAVAIMGVAFIAVISLFTTSARTSGMSMERTDMMMIAQDILEYSCNSLGFDGLIGEADSQPRNVTGLIDVETYEHRYQAQRVTELVPGAENRLLRITVRVKEAAATEDGEEVFLVTQLAKVG